MKSIWSWFRGLPIIAQLVILAILIYIGYQIYLYINRKLNSKNFNAAVTQSQTALKELVASGVHPSYGEAEYTSMANALEQTFIGCGIGWTDVVVPTFSRMKNDADIYSLISAYKVRNIAECGWGSFNGDLAATLSYKLGGTIWSVHPTEAFTTKSIAALNKILSDNGLTFQF